MRDLPSIPTAGRFKAMTEAMFLSRCNSRGREDKPLKLCAALIQLYAENEIAQSKRERIQLLGFSKARNSVHGARLFLLSLLILLFQISSSSKGRVYLWKEGFFRVPTSTWRTLTTVCSHGSQLLRKKEQDARPRLACGQGGSCARTVPRVVL